jgi:hypothetical protein
MNSIFRYFLYIIELEIVSNLGLRILASAQFIDEAVPNMVFIIPKNEPNIIGYALWYFMTYYLFRLRCYLWKIKTTRFYILTPLVMLFMDAFLVGWMKAFASDFIVKFLNEIVLEGHVLYWFVILVSNCYDQIAPHFVQNFVLRVKGSFTLRWVACKDYLSDQWSKFGMWLVEHIADLCIIIIRCCQPVLRYGFL